MTTTLPLYTIKQFTAENPAFSESTLRWLIFNSKERTNSKGTIPGNGFDMVIMRIGRRIYIDEILFAKWIEMKNGVKSPPTSG